ncbi:hypothetical protein LCGC14_0859820 [marine sediment metagenome]|uniref:DUF7336 domain-containing protein n=1 Tax=marine sediment metagenome TaxID=412755 RepID=A0A0F9PT39_9ZZZZ
MSDQPIYIDKARDAVGVKKRTITDAGGNTITLINVNHGGAEIKPIGYWRKAGPGEIYSVWVPEAEECAYLDSGTWTHGKDGPEIIIDPDSGFWYTFDDPPPNSMEQRVPAPHMVSEGDTYIAPPWREPEQVFLVIAYCDPEAGAKIHGVFTTRERAEEAAEIANDSRENGSILSDAEIVEVAVDAVWSIDPGLREAPPEEAATDEH